MKSLRFAASFGFFALAAGCSSAPSESASTEDAIKTTRATIVTCSPDEAADACLDTGSASDWCVTSIHVEASAVNKAKLTVNRGFNRFNGAAPSMPAGVMGMPMAPPRALTATGHLRLESGSLDGAWTLADGDDVVLDAQSDGVTYAGTADVGSGVVFAVTCSVATAGGPPPGTMGLPILPQDAGTGPSFPPGAMGMPVLPQ